MKVIGKEDARPGDWAVMRGKSWIEDMEKIAEIKDVVVFETQEICKAVILEGGAVHRFSDGAVLKGVGGRRIISYERGEL